jgi:hypothetical protein
LLAAFNPGSTHPGRTFGILLIRFSDKFPSSSIPKRWYRLQFHYSEADFFVIHHIKRYPTTSCFIDMVEDEKETSEARRSYIWERIFLGIAVDTGALSLAQRLRESYRRRGQLRTNYLNLWTSLCGKLQENVFYSFSTQLLIEFQLELCYLDIGAENINLEGMIEKWSKVGLVAPFFWECMQAFGKKLAMEGNSGSLARWYGWIPEGFAREKFLRGAEDGFKKLGCDKGFIRLALDLDSYDEMREVLKYLLYTRSGRE